jgi:hypothetical protein
MIKEFLLEWVPWVFNQTAKVLEVTKRVALAAYTEATVEKEWLFLHTIQAPVSSMVFPTIPSEQIQWRVQLNPTRFVDPSIDIDLRHITYLGMTIHLSGKTVDLTEWINEVKWSGRISPSPKQLFTLWCYETGSPYFHLMSTAEVELITEDGNMSRISLV